MNGNNAVVAVLVLVVIVLVAWFGYFKGKSDNTQDIQINIPGTTQNGN